jgi:hypothetical protein
VYSTGDNPDEVLRKSFDEVLRTRQTELADRLVEINRAAAISELLPLAENYLSSAVFKRVERARALSEPPALAGGNLERLKNIFPSGLLVEAGLWSELSFRLRRPLGILSGAIDKLLVTPAANGKGIDVEIIDFKTNRLRSTSSLGRRASRPHGVVVDANLSMAGGMRAGQHLSGAAPPGTPRRPRSQQTVEQLPFDFSVQAAEPEDIPNELSVDHQVRIAASDYQLQMQAYALAVRELMPSLVHEGSTITSTLHFLEPNVEFHLTADLLMPDVCMRAIDDAMMAIVSSAEPTQFPVRPATHCRMCNFLGICAAGREQLRSMRQANDAGTTLLKAVEAGR